MVVRRLAFALAVVLTTLLGVAPAAHSAAHCAGVAGSDCGVHSDGTHFHGLIAVHGSPWVLADAAASGTEAGCGDCRWTIAIACPNESLSDPNTSQACAAASKSPICQPGQLLYRVYLTTAAFLDRVEGTVCIGGQDQVIDIGDRAAGDVARYLKNVIPPDLVIVTEPATATLAGLPTHFRARPPTRLVPVPFGGDGITETITIVAATVDWRWGDREASGWVPAGRALRHTYHRGAVAHGRLTTRWDATYTITYGGDTFGPFDAKGRVVKSQPFRLAVRTSSPVLVSR
jgi:hypothetical protein